MESRTIGLSEAEHSVFQTLAQRISAGDWDNYSRDKDIELYMHIRQEPSMAEGLIFRQVRVIEDKDKENAARQLLVPLHQQHDRQNG